MFYFRRKEIQNGLSCFVVTYIISDKYHETADEIFVKLDRGATGLQSKVCTVRKIVV